MMRLLVFAALGFAVFDSSASGDQVLPMDSVSTADGAMLAASAGDLASSSGNLVRVMDRSGKQRFQSPAGTGDLYSMVFSPDGAMLVTGGMNELNFASPVKVILWDFASGRRLHAWTAEHMVQGVCISPDGEWVAVADGSKNVKLWAVPNRRIPSGR